MTVIPNTTGAHLIEVQVRDTDSEDIHIETIPHDIIAWRITDTGRMPVVIDPRVDVEDCYIGQDSGSIVRVQTGQRFHSHEACGRDWAHSKGLQGARNPDSLEFLQTGS